MENLRTLARCNDCINFKHQYALLTGMHYSQLQEALKAGKITSMDFVTAGMSCQYIIGAGSVIDSDLSTAEWSCPHFKRKTLQNADIEEHLRIDSHALLSKYPSLTNQLCLEVDNGKVTIRRLQPIPKNFTKLYPVRLPRTPLVDLFLQEAPAFLKDHLASVFINLLAESEKIGVEIGVRVCADDAGNVFIERVQGIACPNSFMYEENLLVPKKGYFLAEVHTHFHCIRSDGSLKGADSACFMSDVDLTALRTYGNGFIIYSEGDTVRLRGAWTKGDIINEKPRLKEVDLGKRKTIF